MSRAAYLKANRAKWKACYERPKTEPWPDSVPWPYGDYHEAIGWNWVVDKTGRYSITQCECDGTNIFP